MRTWSLVPVLAVLLAAPAAAQNIPAPPSPISRADVTGTLGWFNANKSDLDEESYNDWYNRSLHGGVGFGWYWTDHLKTEIDYGATTTAKLRLYPRVLLDGQYTATPIEASFQTHKLGVSQVYQGFRNQWFHPYAAAGIETTWERTTEQYGPTYLFDSVSRSSRLVLPPRAEGPETDVIVRPFGAVGFKAYMTPRTFFRSDLRMTVRGGIDEVLLRFGFGVDFE
jgi:opacity protein-like surface antigen